MRDLSAELQRIDIETLDGRSATLAAVGSRSEHRVGPYGVDLYSLDTVAVPALAVEPGALYLIDEIGKMECLSRAFTGAVAALLESVLPVVQTVAQRGSGFIAEVKRHPRAELWEVTRAHRDGLPPRVETGRPSGYTGQP